MLDVLEPEERMDVARFCRMACRRIRAIAARGRKPLLVGGSAMYFKALLWGLFEGPGACPELREELRERAAEEGSDALHAELGEVDPEAAERIHPNDVKRIVRALEVYELTGEPLSDQQREFGGRPAVDCRILGLHWPRERLHERIEQRVERMIDAGLPEEVQALRGRLGPQSGQAVGYKEFVSYFEDDIDYDEAIHKIKAGTRQLAKHQETWFQRFPAVEWLQPAGGEWDEIVAEARKTLTKNDKKVDTLASLR
jgi:tRNA dimethylallyltransferase